MSAESLFLRLKTFLARTAWLKEDCDGLRDNTIRLGRTRYTTGESVLAQADSEIGALHVDSSKRLRLYRENATGDSSEATRLAKTAVIRAVHHYDDFTGDPSSTVSVEGDLYVRDAGGANAWLEEYDGSAYRGLGVLAENRTPATLGSPTQNSGELRMRSAIFQSVEQYRDFYLRVRNIESLTVIGSFLEFWFEREGDGSAECCRINKDRVWEPAEGGFAFDDMTFEMREQNTLVPGENVVDDGFVGSIRTKGGYASGGALRHNHIDVPNVRTSGDAAVTDACLFRFDEVAGAHKALAAESGGAKWIKVNERGVIRFVPMLDEKILPFPSETAYADISTQDGAGTQTLTSAGTWYVLDQWLTDGLAAGCTANAAGAGIEIGVAGVYEVIVTLSVLPSSGDLFGFRLKRIEGPSVESVLDAECFGQSTDLDVFTVSMHTRAEFEEGDTLQVEVVNVDNGGASLAQKAGTLSVKRIA